MPGHGHVTALIGTNKAYVKAFKFISYSAFFILIVMCMVIFMMEFASLENKIYIT